MIGCSIDLINDDDDDFKSVKKPDVHLLFHIHTLILRYRKDML